MGNDAAVQTKIVYEVVLVCVCVTAEQPVWWQI